MTIQQIRPDEVHKLLAEGHRYIDVRTEGEFANGHPATAVNVPIVLPDPTTRQMVMNPDFVHAKTGPRWRSLTESSLSATRPS